MIPIVNNLGNIEPFHGGRPVRPGQARCKARCNALAVRGSVGVSRVTHVRSNGLPATWHSLPARDATRLKAIVPRRVVVE